MLLILSSNPGLIFNILSVQREVFKMIKEAQNEERKSYSHNERSCFSKNQLYFSSNTRPSYKNKTELLMKRKVPQS